MAKKDKKKTAKEKTAAGNAQQRIEKAEAQAHRPEI